MFNYLTSYLVGGSQEEEPAKADAKKQEREDEMKGYGDRFESMEADKSSEPVKQQESGQSGGILNSIYTKMSGHPTCDVVLDHYAGRTHFMAGDDLKGKVRIKTAVDGQHIEHQGIKVSLLGMVLQLPAARGSKNSEGMAIKLDESRSQITAENITAYRQYTFMQIQKQIEYSDSFTNFKEIEFNFKNLAEELRDHETYDGIDNFVKYFIKVQMNYQGGSMIAGNDLEKLHEFTVRNYYNRADSSKRASIMAQKKADAIASRANAALSSSQAADVASAQSSNVQESSHAEPVTNLDQTFQSDSTFAGLGSGMNDAAGEPMNSQEQHHVPSYDEQYHGHQQLDGGIEYNEQHYDGNMGNQQMGYEEQQLDGQYDANQEDYGMNFN